MSQQPMGLMLPKLTPGVKALLIAFSSAFLFLGILERFTSLGTLLVDNLVLSNYAITQFKFWTLLSYAFVHSWADIFHLLFNMLMLFFFGPTLEGRWGTRRFVIFVTLGIVGAGLTFLLFDFLFSGQSTQLLGASGGVLALIVAWGILFPNIPVYLFGILPIKGRHLILFTVAIELLMAVSQQPVSSAAHFGGMATGALVVTGYWRPQKIWQRLQRYAPKPKRKSPKFTVVINPDDDDNAPPGGWVH